MPNKPINTSSVQGGGFNQNLSEDVNRFQKAPDQWTQARNAVTNTVKGDIGDISNEASNYLAQALKYTIIGAIHIGADEWAIFSTDNSNSEIGKFKETNNEYEVVAEDLGNTVLNFHTDHLIKGVGRTAYNCGKRVYWDDGVNPSRTMDLDDPPFVEDCVDSNIDPNYICKDCEDTAVLDANKLRLAPVVKDLAFDIKLGSSAGEIINGSYYVVGAYLVEGQRVTDYSLPSKVQGIFNHSGIGGSLDITVAESDLEFDEFELVLVQFSNFNTVTRRVGVYSTSQTKITLDRIDESWSTIDPALIVIQNNIADKSDAIFRNGQYMLRVGPTNKLDFNYQPLANQIETSWVSVEYDADYYKSGGTNTNYMRDEVYPFFVRWVFNTGDKSRSYHIPARAATIADKSPISGDNVIYDDDGVAQETLRWQVENTASVTTRYTTPPLANDGVGRILGSGKMGYWESSELYSDDKPEVWNASSSTIWGSTATAHDLCGNPIRHHKFPDNATDTEADMITNHYNPNDGTKIRVMGVEFSNIKRPLNNDGTPITNIVGYEILRGSREGNKTVLAKGMVNNLREYKTIDGEESTKTFLYPNYPYNPTTNSDKFLSELATEGSKKANDAGYYLNDDVPMGSGALSFPEGTNVKKDLLTFHSPETNFRNPYLSAKELKIYGQLVGTMEGQFEFPKDHPRHKMINNRALTLSAIIGLGYGILATEGKKTSKYRAPTTDMTNTYQQYAAVGGGGLLSVAAPQAIAQITAVAADRIRDAVTRKIFSSSITSVLLSLAGINSQKMLSVTRSVSGQIAAVFGAEFQQEEETESTAFSSTPGLLRVISGAPSFLTFWAEGIDKMLNLIYAFTPYRQYALQQVSHCFYDTFVKPGNDSRKGISKQSYLNPVLQDFDNDYRINNIYRSRTVALKLHNDLEFPTLKEDSQKLYSDVHPNNWSNPDYIYKTFREKTSSHYVGLKQRLSNQYGQLRDIKQVPVSTSYLDIQPIVNPNNVSELNTTFKSGPLFNGDVYIGRYTEKNTMFFFYDWLMKQPDGHPFNYKLRKMITHPRFWMDTDPYDIGEFINSIGDLFNGGTTPPDFDPNIVDPKFTNSDPQNPDYVENPVCDCDVRTHCYFVDTNIKGSANLAEDVCDYEQEAFGWSQYIEFLQECACLRQDDDDGDDCPACKTEDDPDWDDWGNPEHPAQNVNCKKEYTGELCTKCPTWSKPGKYNCEGKGKWARKIKRAEKKVQRAEKRRVKALEELYEAYIDKISGNSQDKGLADKFRNLTTPTDKYAFDQNKPQSGLFKMAVKEAYMYLFNSGVRDFFVESEINLDYRDWGDKPGERHYDHTEYTELKELFDSNHIKSGNYMKYDYSLSVSKLFNNYISWGSLQERSYDPNIAEECFQYRPKRVIYSLPQSLENKKDNWRVFLPNNYKDFNSITTAIKPIGKNGAIMLFENESPVQFTGVDTLQTDGGTKITLGDGGLFNQPLQNLVNAEYPHEYGSCQNRLAVANTPAGLYYMSQNQGKIFQVTGQGLNEISSVGLKWWFANYLPYKLTENTAAFTNSFNQIVPFELSDNPVSGIGCQIIYDNKNQVVFFCKKDWVIRTDIDDVVTYDFDLAGDNFVVNGLLSVKLGDPRYFKSASWTISWDPKLNRGNGGWASWHDWHPDLTLPTKNTYMTTKANGLWVHADRCDSYCNFYGVDYPFEVEQTLNTGVQVTTMRNVSYMMEAYVYDVNCDDRFHLLDFNFDEAIIHNSEQCSGLLKLNLAPKNNAPLLNTYPITNFDSIDILYSKEEQKYRFNQFSDITDDRGEFNSNVQRMIFNTEANGYIKNLNANNLDYYKSPVERKRFRHYKHSVLLRRRVSGNVNMSLSLASQPNLISPR